MNYFAMITISLVKLT